MTTDPRLPFDPIDRAGTLWESHFGESSQMKVITSVMRVQQLLLAELDQRLKPFDITFARYEVLVLLTFSKRKSLPLSKIGERLMVHPTSVTNAIQRLEAQGLVQRLTDPEDGRRTLATLTPEGRRLTKKATKVLMDADFALTGLSPDEEVALYGLLRQFRASAGDFPYDGEVT